MAACELSLELGELALRGVRAALGGLPGGSGGRRAGEGAVRKYGDEGGMKRVQIPVYTQWLHEREER